MIAEVKQVLGFSKPNDNAPNRLKTCKGCIFAEHNRFGTWCGSPIVGEVVEVEDVEHNIKTVELCGCRMETKTVINDSQCPINAWQ